MALYMGKLRTVCFDDDICQTLLHTTARTSRCSDRRAFGKITGMFSAYYKYGVVFVDSRAGAISLLIDFECSGFGKLWPLFVITRLFQAYSR